MNNNTQRRLRIALFVPLLCLMTSAAFVVSTLFKTSNGYGMKEAQRILPGYTIVFDGRTNIIQKCGSLRAFSRQHEMMGYLQLLAPYVEQYHHQTNHPIMIYESEDKVIFELPSRAKFPPYNWTIYWGSSYYFMMEIDKKTKKVVRALQG